MESRGIEEDLQAGSGGGDPDRPEMDLGLRLPEGSEGENPETGLVGGMVLRRVVRCWIDLDRRRFGSVGLPFIL